MAQEIENLEEQLLNSPAARARFLADTLELLERNGVDTSTPEFQQQMGGALDVSEGTRFVGGLAASTVVIAIASAGQRAAMGSKIGNAASTVVIAIASAGQRAAMGSKIGNAASTVVIAIASAGQRGALGSRIGNAASTVVIAIASAGQRGALGTRIGNAASTVVIAIASAGQRGALGRAAGGFETAQESITITIPAAVTIADVAQALQQLAGTLLSESEALEDELLRARDALGNG